MIHLLNIDEKNKQKQKLVKLIELFLHVQNIIIYQKKLYKKKDNTSSTYIHYGSLEDLYFFKKEVIEFLKKEFKLQIPD
jgi:hypothetical protein